MKKEHMFETAARSGARTLLVLALAVPAAGQITARVSVDSAGLQGNGNVGLTPTITPDGRHVAFTSSASNLVPGDTNGTSDVFVRDRQTGTTERMSVDSGGAQGNASVAGSAISADGRYVFFNSGATNLVPGDTNGVIDVFVRDRQTGTTERISVDSLEMQGNGGNSGLGDISSDGRYVSFSSSATDLVSGDTNGWSDVFVRDRQAGTTERVSITTSGAQPNDDSAENTISDDGRYVAYTSYATNLVPGDTNAGVDVFLRDRQSGTTERASISTSGAQGNDYSDFPAISADGRYVAFTSEASNFDLGDTNGKSDIYVRDRQNNTTERVSLDSGGAQGNDNSDICAISSDGRYVAFMSGASNLVPGDTNGWNDIFLRDRQSLTTERASVGSNGTQGNGSSSFRSRVSPDGRYVVFYSNTSNFVPGDTNGVTDIFVRDRIGVPGWTSLCHPGVDGVIGCPCGQPANPAGGCANHGAGATSGAVLGASGGAYLSSDTLLLTTSNHRSPAIGVLNVFFSFKPGTVTTGMASGAGVRCTSGGDLRRLYTMQVFGGTGSKPGIGDPSVSAKSASFLPHSIAAGETRYYFNTYRDGQASGPCGSSAVSTNLTNLGSIAWIP